MAGTNKGSIKFLRKNSVDSTVELKYGQPFYNNQKNYLTIGDKNNKKTNGRPITVREVVAYTGDSDTEIKSSTAEAGSLRFEDTSATLTSGNTTLTLKADGIHATTFKGALDGNARTATTLETSRSITIKGNGITATKSFDGSASIELDIGGVAQKLQTGNDTAFIKNSGRNVTWIKSNTWGDDSTYPEFNVKGTILHFHAPDDYNEGDTYLGSIRCVADNINTDNKTFETSHFNIDRDLVVNGISISDLNSRLDSLGFSEGYIVHADKTIGYVAKIGRLGYGYIYPGVYPNTIVGATIPVIPITQNPYYIQGYCKYPTGSGQYRGFKLRIRGGKIEGAQILGGAANEDDYCSTQDNVQFWYTWG